MILGFDVSHFQQGTNFAAAKTAGRDFVVLKATEGTTYLDPSFAANRKAAHAAGLVVGLYHFARAGNVGAEVSQFLHAIGTLQPGEFLVLDQEVTNTVGWCRTWLDTVTAATGVAPLIYMNSGSVTGVGMGDWSGVAASYGLWLAKYDSAPATQNAVPYWGVPAMKQYSSSGSVLGVAGAVDVDSFFGTTAQLLAYGKGAPTPTPAPEVDVNLSDPIPNANPDTKGKVPTTTVANLLQDVQANAAYAARQTTDADVKFQQVLDTVAKAQAVTIDEAKLAAALLSDPASVDALGKAIAAHLKLSSG